MSSSSISKPERGGCLSWWLGVSVVVFILALVSYFAIGVRGSQAVLVIGIIWSVVCLIALYGIYKWKRWGVYSFIIVNVVGLILNSIANGSLSIFSIILTTVEVIVLLYVVRNKWKVFD
ncbi:MAG: hypothetical protein GC179_22755 [Anaerolineaceae bacterium]|nr:hypothetical protein [Anaerolineaceae bacterium]